MSARIALATAALLATIVPASAQATEADATQEYPRLTGELTTTLGLDTTFRSTDRTNELTDLFVESELAATFRINPFLALNFGATLEPVRDPRPSTNRAFGDIGLYADTLNVETNLGGFTVVLGKFGPGFGTAWDVTPGVYGTDFAEDYELSEWLGLGIAYELRAEALGAITFGTNVFTRDNTFLSDSAFARRGPLRLSAGGAGNTGRLNNFSVTIDGAGIPALAGFSWHLGYRHLQPGKGDASAENGFVVGIGQNIEMEGATLAFNSEIAFLKNASASADDALYVTTGLGIASGPWHGELSGTLRQFRPAAGGLRNDYLLQASAGYEWPNGVDLSLGSAYDRTEAVDSHVVGLRLTKALSF